MRQRNPEVQARFERVRAAIEAGASETDASVAEGMSRSWYSSMKKTDANRLKAKRRSKRTPKKENYTAVPIQSPISKVFMFAGSPKAIAETFKSMGGA